MMTHYPMRLFEWIMSIAMLSVAFTVILYPTSIEDSSFHFLSLAGFTPPVVIGFYGTVGAARITALLINGRSIVYGPMLRFVGSVSGILIWSEMAVALLLRAPIVGSLSIGFGIYMTLSFGEVLSAYRAAADGALGRKFLEEARK